MNDDLADLVLFCLASGNTDERFCSESVARASSSAEADRSHIGRKCVRKGLEG